MTSPTDRPSCNRRALLAVTGGLLTVGCTGPLDSGTTERRPILVGLTVENDTNETHDYRLRVRYGTDNEETTDVAFERSGALEGRSRQTIDAEFPNEPGRHVVEIAVDGGDWHSDDLTDRFTQEERICYRQEVSIEGRDEVSFLT